MKFSKLVKEELTVFIRVNIDNLNEFSKFIPLKVNKDDKRKSDKMKIKIVRKYLLISSKSKLIFVKNSLFMKIFLGLLKDKIWLIEYLNNESNLYYSWLIIPDRLLLS